MDDAMIRQAEHDVVVLRRAYTARARGFVKCPVCEGKGTLDNPLTGESIQCADCAGEGEITIIELDKIVDTLKKSLKAMPDKGATFTLPSGVTIVSEMRHRKAQPAKPEQDYYVVEIRDERGEKI